KSVWAGWQDAPLSNHARAAAAYFASTNTHFTDIYASPLKRAFDTAQAILTEQPEPKPSFSASPDVREQYFGIAEGKAWSLKMDEDTTREEMYAQGIFPILTGRSEKFPGGESLDDLQARCEKAVNELVVPLIWNAAQTGKKAHIAIVSHGLCISELIAVLVRKDRNAQAGAHGGKWTGLMNTAWSRLTIDIAGWKEGETLAVNPTDPLPLHIKVTHTNEHSHLDRVKRQHGGIGSSAYDPSQKDIRAYFGGATITPNDVKDSGTSAPPRSPVEVEEGRAVSNVFDEVEVSQESSDKS
ncbi:phosphoglycerate mutase-like protein, partial [Fomitiporia mediterranea MF3/22]|uniref:phosphoglycerate mutase-like protein n=1 Tax=Fomitiporia mediterranea (strain MF3/22) TaxID=694068 RepID=UPI0004409261